MTDTALTADVTADISDEKVDKFFESGGNVDIEGQANNEVSRNDTNQTDPTQNQAIDNSQAQTAKTEEAAKTDDKQTEFERNYKAAMHEERERRKELQRQLDEQRNQSAQMQNVLNKILERANQQQQPQAPDFNADPIEALRHNQETLARALEQQHMTLAQRQQIEQQQLQKQQFINQYSHSAKEYANEVKDFGDAYKYLNDSRLKEYLEAGYTQQQANELLESDELAIVAKAYQDGVNPASRIYNLAKLRGYQFKQQQAQAQTQSADKKLETLEKGMQASKSLNNLSGQGEKQVTLEALAQMSNDELDEFLDNNKNWNKVLKMG